MKYEDPFVISKRSKRGLLVLILASLGLIFFPRVYMFFQKEEAFVINSEKIAEFERTHKKFDANRECTHSIWQGNRFGKQALEQDQEIAAGVRPLALSSLVRW